MQRAPGKGCDMARTITRHYAAEENHWNMRNVVQTYYEVEPSCQY